MTLSVNDLLSLFGDALTGIAELDIFLYFSGALVFACVVGLVLWLAKGKNI